MTARLVIEYPSVGATYEHDEYAVYAYDEFPRGSVLEGQERRTFRGSFEKLEDAQKAFPTAEWNGGGTGYHEIVIPDVPPAWFDRENAGEYWSEADAY